MNSYASRASWTAKSMASTMSEYLAILARIEEGHEATVKRYKLTHRYLNRPYYRYPRGKSAYRITDQRKIDAFGRAAIRAAPNLYLFEISDARVSDERRAWCVNERQRLLALAKTHKISGHKRKHAEMDTDSEFIVA
jgi:hypothetical protein